MKFNVGDKVKVVKITGNLDKQRYIGGIFTIKDVNPNGKSACDGETHYGVKESYCRHIFRESELELVQYIKFVKENLEDGMVVEYRDGDRALVFGNKLMAFNHHTKLDNFTNTLENLYTDNVDIVCVYLSKAEVLEDYFKDAYLTIVWKRAPVREMTVAEIEKELGYKIKVIGN